MFDRKIPFDPEVEMMVTEEEGKAPMRWENSQGFTLSWIARGWGFGMLSFSKLDKLEDAPGLYCGDEYMGLVNATLVLSRYCEKTPKEEWPKLLEAYGSVEAVMTDVVDWESKPRDPEPSDGADGA